MKSPHAATPNRIILAGCEMQGKQISFNTGSRKTTDNAARWAEVDLTAVDKDKRRVGDSGGKPNSVPG